MGIYEIQHYTLCDGWVNTWSIEEPNGESKPQVFNTFEDAVSALDEFLDDELYEYQQGNIDSMYERDEFQIVEVTSSP
jgi:hypothetical protein